ncbi:MAG: HEAT repeat domain-containing protein, partial [Planctomycetota bacterium]
MSETLRSILELELNVYERKIEAKHIQRLLDGILARPVVSIGLLASNLEEHQAAAAVHVQLRRHAGDLHDNVVSLRKRESEFRVAFAKTIAEDDRNQLILSFAKDLGASARQLRGDERAFSRWFGEDAIRDRYVRRLGALERELSFVLGRLGVVSAYVLGTTKKKNEKEDIWIRFEIEKSIKPLLAYDGDSRVVCAAFKALSRALRALPHATQEGYVEESTLQFIYRSAMQARQDVWIQCEALTLLQALSPSSLCRVLEKRLAQAGEDEDLFLRRRAIRILGEEVRRHPELLELLPVVRNDPSEFVRQAVAEIVPKLPEREIRKWFHSLALTDTEPAVRAATVLHGLALLEKGAEESTETLRDTLVECLGSETNSFTLRVALRVACEGTRFLALTSSPFLDAWCELIATAIESLRDRSEDLSVKRWAGEAAERMWCLETEDTRELFALLSEELENVKRGRLKRIPHEKAPVDDEALGRVLSVLAHEGHG